MVGDFSLKSTKQNNCLIVDTYGYINNVGGQKILDEFTKHRENGINNCILNLAETKIVNSIGISYLIEIIEKLNDSDGKLVFINMDQTIEKTFSIMGLLQFAQKADSVEDALKLLC